MLLLFILLLGISIWCAIEAKTTNEAIKFIFSITVAGTLTFVMEGSMQGYLSTGRLQGGLLATLYYALPLSAFTCFQLLLYDIRIFE